MERPLPRHIAIIMDGNGRWAKWRGKGRIYGHRHGIKSTRAILKAAAEHRIPELTLYTFSSENWSRPTSEVNALLRLFRETLAVELGELIKNGVHLRFIGDLSAFDESIKQEIRKAERATANLDTLRVNIALNYGGRWDIVAAMQRVGRDHRGITDNQTVQKHISEHLKHHSVGDVDLMIRTGGEFRLSNFLLWQSAYAELYFCDAFWPDFGRTEFIEALKWFSLRQRRFGGIDD